MRISDWSSDVCSSDLASEQAVTAPAPIVAATRPTVDVNPVRTASTPEPSGWAIQVASMPSQSGALSYLKNTAKQAPTVLADASPFTQSFDLKGTTYFRARRP